MQSIRLNNGKLVVFDDAESLAKGLAERFVALAEVAVKQRGRFTVALSGGSTPQALYCLLAKPAVSNRVPWNRTHLFWGDERCVPPEHPESNFGVARDYLLGKISIPSSHVFRVRGEDPPPDTARAYAKTLHEVFKTEPDWPTFDLIILGMGPDGHTASLMPGTAALQDERRWVVENVVRSLQTVRITMTLPVINHARQVWFLVTGAKKSSAYAKAQAGPSLECPASLVQPESGELRWYVDRAVIS